MEKFNPDQVQINFDIQDPFDSWAKKYFKKTRLNVFVPRIEALNSFRDLTGHDHFSPKNFMLELDAWCFKNNLELNPPEHFNTAGRIIRKAPRANPIYTMAVEMIYLKSITN